MFFWYGILIYYPKRNYIGGSGYRICRVIEGFKGCRVSKYFRVPLVRDVYHLLGGVCKRPMFGEAPCGNREVSRF